MGDEYVIIDLLFMLILFGIIGMAITRKQRMGSGKTSQAEAKIDPAKQNTVSEAKSRADNPAQIVEDVKITQTSRIVDAIQILDDLGTASPGYRHYCELIGQSQASGGVIAPYSQREVAYYDLRCYRIEVRGGKDVETLVAHERSIDPFYFRDAASDDKVYVDLDSFGNNCILVNSTNRVEGPNSDFSKKFSSVVGAAKQQAATGVPGVMAAVGMAAQRGSNVLRGVRAGAGMALDGVRASLNGGLAPAYAGAYGAFPVADSNAPRVKKGSNVALAASMGGRPGGAPRPGMGGMGGQRPGYGSPRPQGTRPGTGSRPQYGSNGLPVDLNSFLGSAMGSGRLGGPYYYHNDPVSSSIETLVGMSLGALVGSFASASKPSTTVTYTVPQPRPAATDPTNVSSVNGFRGYRIIEDVVPLNSPIYALGEIYRNGPDVFIGRSVSESYPSSYFATKPEAEVIAALS